MSRGTGRWSRRDHFPGSVILADVPSYSAEQRQERLEDFRRRRRDHARRSEGGRRAHDRDRSSRQRCGIRARPFGASRRDPARRARGVLQAFLEARGLESTSIPRKPQAVSGPDCTSSPASRRPHFRLARLLEQAEAHEEAYREYVKARDLDGHPMRCPTAFQDVYRQLAPRFGAILVDGQEVLRRPASAQAA